MIAKISLTAVCLTYLIVFAYLDIKGQVSNSYWLWVGGKDSRLRLLLCSEKGGLKPGARIVLYIFFFSFSIMPWL